MCIKGHYRIICIKYVVVKNRFHLHLLNVYKQKYITISMVTNL